MGYDGDDLVLLGDARLDAQGNSRSFLQAQNGGLLRFRTDEVHSGPLFFPGAKRLTLIADQRPSVTTS